MTDPQAVLRLSAVRKGYHGLRPLRIMALEVLPAERVSIGGVDAPAAEMLVNLITGATLPEEGEVWTFGRRTTDISNADDWLAWLDRFGIVSERGVLLEAATLEQNLAMPFTLDIDPVPAEVTQQVSTLARECGLPESQLRVRAAELPADARLRAHLARAVALSPRLLLVEHPTGRVDERARSALAADVARVSDIRRLPAVIITNDDEFARAAATRNLRLDGATGHLQPVRKRWLR